VALRGGLSHMSVVPLCTPPLPVTTTSHPRPYDKDTMGQPVRVQALRILRAMEGAGRVIGSVGLPRS